jgi:hypothetical protein
VAGRALTFADPVVLRMAREDFVAVAADDWYQRRRQDEEGEFFRKVADQGPRKGQGGATRQGIYVLTADGRLLAYRNHHDPSVMRAVLQQGLKEWQKLPEEKRRAGTIKVGEPAKVDAAYARVAPKGGLILNVFTRILDHNDKNELCHGTCQFPGGDRAARDHLWLTAEEWKALIPANPRQGDTLTVSDRLAKRLGRFHLVDNTRGEPPHWSREQVRSGSLKLTVEEANRDKVRLKIEGSYLLATSADSAKAERGFDVRVLGYIQVDAAKQAIERFDVVAVGEHWGEGPFTRRARPGRTPLGVAIELARGDSAADRVPPQAARSLQAYLQAEK